MEISGNTTNTSGRIRSALLGAIIGDIAGSRFEFNNYKRKTGYYLFSGKCRFTDDTVMSVAAAKSISESYPSYSNLSESATKNMQEFGQKYPDAGYGGRFYNWLFSENPHPYNSYGNGSAMRVSPCGQVARSLEEAKLLSKAVTEVTHNHPEGLKGAEATAVAIFMAKSGAEKDEIQKVIEKDYYTIDFTLDGIRKKYKFDVSCQGSVPQAFEAFFESTDFEDAIRNAISIGGDSDTIAAVCGSIAAPYYGIPNELADAAFGFLDSFLTEIINGFENFCHKQQSLLYRR
jgi:ADP-ribosyl-[dinitrogen reductase] hydrolase